MKNVLTTEKFIPHSQKANSSVYPLAKAQKIFLLKQNHISISNK